MDDAVVLAFFARKRASARPSAPAFTAVSPLELFRLQQRNHCKSQHVTTSGKRCETVSEVPWATHAEIPERVGCERPGSSD